MDTEKDTDANDDASTQFPQESRPSSAQQLAQDASTPYLVVFERGSIYVHQLVPGQDFLMGRSSDADLQLQDSSASRLHARIGLSGNEYRIADLDTLNGTLVNGQRVVSSCSLISGDEIRIGKASLVFHRPERSLERTVVRDIGQLRQRIGEELLRVLRYPQHRVSVLVCQWNASPNARRPQLEQILREYLPELSVAAWEETGQLVAVLPFHEENQEEHTDRIKRLTEAITDSGPPAQMGLSHSPRDGCDIETLLSGARRSARASAPGRITTAVELQVTRRVGDFDVIIANPVMIAVYELVERLGPSHLSVLITGETGVGKELVARALHEWSPRQRQRFVAINCAAITASLFESELFGYEKGAFSDAKKTKLGFLEVANGGTVFLDEIGEMPTEMQAKLLRVLEDRRFCRVGGTREIELDIRIVAATNRDVEEEVKKGNFRADVLARLQGFQVYVPPLRHRKDEVPILASALLSQSCARAKRPKMTLSDAVVQRLLTYDWPRNVRELKQVMDSLLILADGDIAEWWHLPATLGGRGLPGSTLAPEPVSAASRPQQFLPLEQEIRELERQRISDALRVSGGNRRRAADLLSMPERTFYYKAQRLGIITPTRPPRLGKEE